MSGARMNRKLPAMARDRESARSESVREPREHNYALAQPLVNDFCNIV